jgi:hypothetical protein
MRQRSRPAVPDDAAVVEDLLKLSGGSTALSGCQVCLSAYIHVIESRLRDKHLTNLKREDIGNDSNRKAVRHWGFYALGCSLSARSTSVLGQKPKGNPAPHLQTEIPPKTLPSSIGLITYTNGQICSVYWGGFRDSITVPDGFSAQDCKAVADYEIRPPNDHYQLACATANGIVYGPEDKPVPGCGWR